MIHVCLFYSLSFPSTILNIFSEKSLKRRYYASRSYTFRNINLLKVFPLVWIIGFCCQYKHCMSLISFLFIPNSLRPYILWVVFSQKPFRNPKNKSGIFLDGPCIFVPTLLWLSFWIQLVFKFLLVHLNAIVNFINLSMTHQPNLPKIITFSRVSEKRE